ncbi:MAG: hypothetical protein R3321_06270 [Nitrososphaeraceae archaeon]|nr:hypothetical protein [Nitrososphaeraceae archaeon]
MATADNFALEERKAEEAIQWMNSYALEHDKKFEAKLEGYILTTIKFGNFQIISWKGEWSVARNLIKKTSKKLNMKVIESGYHKKDSFFLSLIGANKEIAKVYNKGNLVGNLILGKKSGKWVVKKEHFT